MFFFFFSSRRRHTRCLSDWSSDVCSSDLSEPSTHILKPNHLSDDYPASVINEYFVMSLARSLGLPVPPVFRRYTPEPVYIIERFDRLVDNTGRTQRRHIIDAC